MAITFTMITWMFTAVIMTYNVYTTWRPFTLSTKHREKVRTVALRRSAGKQQTAFQADVEADHIKVQKRFENLVIYARFVDSYRVFDLNCIVNLVRVQRMRLNTILTPLKLTLSHLEIYTMFFKFLPEYDPEDPKKNKKERRRIERTIIYAMTHPDEAADIYSVVAERGVHELKHIKQLLKDHAEAPAIALSDGLL